MWLSTYPLPSVPRAGLSSDGSCTLQRLMRWLWTALHPCLCCRNWTSLSPSPKADKFDVMWKRAQNCPSVRTAVRGCRAVMFLFKAWSVNFWPSCVHTMVSAWLEKCRCSNTCPGAQIKHCLFICVKQFELHRRDEELREQQHRISQEMETLLGWICPTYLTCQEQDQMYLASWATWRLGGYL